MWCPWYSASFLFGTILAQILPKQTLYEGVLWSELRLWVVLSHTVCNDGHIVLQKVTLSFRKQGLLLSRWYASLDGRLLRRSKWQYPMRAATLAMMEICETHILNESVSPMRRYTRKKCRKIQNHPEICLIYREGHTLRGVPLQSSQARHEQIISNHHHLPSWRLFRLLHKKNGHSEQRDRKGND